MYTAEYKIDYRSVYDTFDKICNDTDLSAVISYSMTYDAADVMDNDNFATAISIVLIGMVRKHQ